MIEETGRGIPSNHPVRQLFRQLTERGMQQAHLDDHETAAYLTNLLTSFIHVENLYRIRGPAGERLEYLVDIIARASESMSPSVRREYYKQIGDFTLFMLGLYPESLDRPRRPIGANYYAAQGRRSYSIVASIESPRPATALYRRLSDQFEQCVLGLNWVKLYMHDPFYQYMLREFGIT